MQMFSTQLLLLYLPVAVVTAAGEPCLSAPATIK